MKNRIIKVELVLLDNGTISVHVTKEFAPKYGGGTQTFDEDGGISWHRALDVAREMVTVSPAQRTNLPVCTCRFAQGYDYKCAQHGGEA